MSQQTTIRKPRKGDVITLARIWTIPDERNGYRAIVYTRTVRVESWGKVQATFTDVATGEFIKERGYTEVFAHATNADDLAALVVQTKDRIRQRVQATLNLSRRWLADYAGKSRPDVLQKARENLTGMEAALTAEIEVADYNTLVARLTRK
jgi:hypothetical protein